MRRVFELDWYKIWSDIDSHTASLSDPKSILDTEDGSLFLCREIKDQIEAAVNDDINSEES